MSPARGLLTRFDLRTPIVVAPMGGATSPSMVVAACEAGALGSLAGAYLSPAALAGQLREVQAGTRRPFAVNLFVPGPARATPADLERARRELAPWRERLGLPDGPPLAPPVFADQVEELFAARPAAFSFCFGLPPPAVLERCRALGIATLGTATSADEALLLERAGVDFICVQGPEAGGHRGTFDPAQEPPAEPLLALLPRVATAVRTELVAAGGLMDGAAIAQVLRLGAVAAQLGTAFLRTPESIAPKVHQEAVARAAETATGADATAVTRAFSGRPARGIANRFMREVRSPAPFPAQNGLTREIRTAAVARGDPDAYSSWAGTGAARSRALPTRELIQLLTDELDRAR